MEGVIQEEGRERWRRRGWWWLEGTRWWWDDDGQRTRNHAQP
jgi:hypothetical protein